MRHIFFFILVFLLSYACKPAKDIPNNNERLWYVYPAKYWNSQGLHIGNGYFGATFFGGVEKETFALSDPSMWTGEPAMGRWDRAGVNPKARESLQLIREATFNRQTHLADSLISENFFGSSELHRRYF
jgi:alpha-L-fucosidase 2